MEINIKSNQFQNVLKKAIEKKPFVKIGATANSYLVRGSKDNFYPVSFRRGAGGKKIGDCICSGAMRGFHCYHLAAALLAHSAFVRAGLRRAAVRLQMSPLAFRGSESVRNLI